MRQKGSLRLFCCGGFGINNGTHFERAVGQTEHGYAETFPVYIDTSMSNLKSDVNPEHVFLLEDVDGSGKVRKENHVQIAKTVKAILLEHGPKDVNVVIFSASGGSGSVFGPLLMKELLDRGETVLGIVVGSDNSILEARNTRDTLKSLEAIAARVDAPTVIFYEHNERGVPRSDIDARCRAAVAALCVLASANNDEMDSRDIQNWARFNRTTSVAPRLALFDVYNTNKAADESDEPVSIASLFESPDAEQLTIEPEYHAAGYPRGTVKNFQTMHFVITLGGIPAIYKRMEKKIAEQEEVRAARVVHDKIISSADDVTDDCLVLS